MGIVARPTAGDAPDLRRRLQGSIWLRTFMWTLAFPLAACNAPPLYESRAQEYLEHQQVPGILIARLVERRELSVAESVRLEELGNRLGARLLPSQPGIAVLHLLASNSSIPPEMIVRLAGANSEEIRWGVAYNPKAPKELLLAFRTRGKYSTMNEYLARNPQLPTDVLVEMHLNKEANLSGFAMNPNCPLGLMREILERGTDQERAWLAGNPSLPPDVAERLSRDSSPVVRRFLSQNRSVKLPIAPLDRR